MAFNVETIDDAGLSNKQLKEKYKGKKLLFVCKIKDYNNIFFGRSLKRLSSNLECFYPNLSPHKLSYIFRKYGNHYKDEKIEHLGFFIGEENFMGYYKKKPETQEKYWNELTSDYKLYPILSK